MANESSEQVAGQKWHGGNAPGLVGVYGRLRIEVAASRSQRWWSKGRTSRSSPDTSGPADATRDLRRR